MYIESAFGRTKEEAMSKLDRIMIREHPDLPYSRSYATVSKYGDQKDENKYIAKYEL